MKKEFEKEQKDNQIDDAFLDMPDMEDDEKFRQWLEEEYLKEADAIEEALFDGRKFEDNQDIVEKLSVSRENFYQRAREEGLLEDTADEKAEDEKNTEEAVPESTEKKILEFRKNADVSKDTARDANRNSGKKKHSYMRLGRIAGIAGLCLICVFAASMSSEANRKYLVNSVRIWSGDDTKTVNYNDDSNENANLDEDKAIADIEEKLGIEMPRFYYRPPHFRFLSYEVIAAAETAKIEYQYGRNVIFLYIDKETKNTSSNINSAHGDDLESQEITKDNIEVSVGKVQSKNDEEPCYIAEWETNETSYRISGRIEEAELKKIIKNMEF